MSNILRARSSRFPRKDEDYINTTYYDDAERYLDIGYQKLRRLKYYQEFNKLTKLFVDNNELVELPDAALVPCLEELTCSGNKLKDIPFYPYLNFLNVSSNQITKFDKYHNSRLTFFDCSYNSGFIFNFVLPACTQLYINNNDLSGIDLNLTPNLKVLDCSYNLLKTINGGSISLLIEIDAQHNQLIELPLWPNLIRLTANNNEIQLLQSYPNLIAANVANNKIIRIFDQPSLKKLIANNNNISKIGVMNNLELIDFSYNNLPSIHMPKNAEYVSLQFNPLKSVDLNNDVLKSIKELQVSYEAYQHIYPLYYDNFNAVNIRTSEEKLEDRLKRVSFAFDNNVITELYEHFKCIKFKERENGIYQTTVKIYKLFFAKNNVRTMEEIVADNDFRYLLSLFTKVYYKTLVVTLYFNEYLLDIIQESEMAS